ncbi:oxidoreductase, short-chain dehydrogenase/reductase family [Paecilomyces variotii No. 5]|uniref:Oxidoreductase, short-chain dehydrogenase/reductase family n=1 Tax=Byssochlamys spectabilis (strain No. 5 / NBRC 109023) TaxID=1356009 RepID=V5FIH8_BYSSN|nr:oxidoreductase, short-chain dehydrogenase/reductase family [Paecilomyces variotii No. 5]
MSSTIVKGSQTEMHTCDTRMYSCSRGQPLYLGDIDDGCGDMGGKYNAGGAVVRWHCSFIVMGNSTVAASWILTGSRFVFGAGSGIGRQIALTLALGGASTVVCADMNLQNAQQTADTISSSHADQPSDIRASAMQIDVRKEDEVENLVHVVRSQYGRIDICVDTAGVGVLKQTPISSMSQDEYRDMDEVHNIGSFLIIRAMLKAMLQQELRGIGRSSSRGSIVILTSLASEGVYIGVGDYSSAKRSVKGLVQTAAIENARKGIRINAAAPSYVSGPMINKFFDGAPEAKEAMLGDLAMGRLAEPEEVADAVVFLASSAASYINGHTLVIDGANLQPGCDPEPEGFGVIQIWKIDSLHSTASKDPDRVDGARDGANSGGSVQGRQQGTIDVDELVVQSLASVQRALALALS